MATSLGIHAEATADTEQFLASQPGAFDVITMLHVIEHVPKASVIPLLAAARTALTPHGRLLIEVPNMGDPLNGLFYRYDDFTHEVGFTETSLRYVLGKAGFGQVAMLEQIGATGAVGRAVQRAGRKVLHGVLFVVNLPNGRQMRRAIGPVLSVRADP